MKICVVHNFYQWPGGEDRVFEQDQALLSAHGHEVVRFTRHNDSIKEMNPLTLGVNTIWSRATASELGALVREQRPEVVHFHNTVPLISPAAYYAARREGAAVVQTLHNYRLICPAATLFRAGAVCEDCVGRRFAWPAVEHACYRGGRPASAALAAMLSIHRLLGTWKDKVDRFVALTEFARSKFCEGGLPADSLVVKPNYCRGPDSIDVSHARCTGGLYVGRLSREKGIDTMAAAWRSLQVPLAVIGEGPLATRLETTPGVSMQGKRSADEVVSAMRQALFLVVPSEWFEGFPMVIAEAFSQGLPVIAARLGGLAEIVEDGATGLHFTAGDVNDLIEKVDWAASHREKMEEMGRNARRVYLQRYTPEVNYDQLMVIYESAIARARGAGE